ncbi:uncharacterized protein LOC126733533 [Anthonomus grandis grandis]|uniref:uncharacterized protein LOC126733533 n=1 Tax=Anthonomus grandis grandis TaxID=2921223 RepID=UPI0021651C25|nr:uncharacterized protein LOC126733533 [Anthonomus grandis grandis]
MIRPYYQSFARHRHRRRRVRVFTLGVSRRPREWLVLLSRMRRRPRRRALQIWRLDRIGRIANPPTGACIVCFPKQLSWHKVYARSCASSEDINRFVFIKMQRSRQRALYGREDMRPIRADRLYYPNHRCLDIQTKISEKAK